LKRQIAGLIASLTACVLLTFTVVLLAQSHVIPANTLPVTTPSVTEPATEPTTIVTTIETTTPATENTPTKPNARVTAAPVPQSLAESVEAIAQSYNTSGLSLVAFRGQELVYSQYYGFADMGRSKPVNADTKYRIASVSKTISGMLAMGLVADGKLDLDKDISEYTGIQITSYNYPDVPITPRMLMTHTSSIIDGPTYTANTTAAPLNQILAVGDCFSKSKPGTRYSYSNFGAGLLAGVIEGASGEPHFYDYANEQFSAWGIDAGYLRNRIKATDTIAQIYQGKTLRADIPAWGRIDYRYAAFPIGRMYLLAHGDLIISAQDLSKFAIAMAGDGTFGGQSFLPAAQVNEMNSIQPNTGNQYGLCVSVSRSLVDGRTMHGHAGQAYGMVSGFYYDPTDHTGVVFITNGCSIAKNEKGIYKITNDLVNLIYDNVL